MPDGFSEGMVPAEVGAVQELTDDQFEALRDLISATREDMIRNSTTSLERIEAVRAELSRYQADMTKLIGQVDGLAAVVERHGTRLDLLERAQSMFMKEKGDETRSQRIERRALIGWIIAGLGMVLAAVEWVISTFSMVSKH